MKASRLVCLLFVLAAAAWAQDEQEPGKDHPQIPRFPNTYIDHYESNDFAFAEFLIDTEGTTQKIEGERWSIIYRTREGARVPDGVEVIRNYENAFKKNGGTLILKVENPGNPSYATLKMPAAPGELWLQVNSEVGIVEMTIIRTKEMVQKIELSAGAMERALGETGRVALRGILFETGKSDIKPASEPLLGEIAKLFERDEGLLLTIEGHTDNVGQKADNQRLSEQRASAVKSWLVAHGVAAEKLETAGFGDSKPDADNVTEDGRARNRRVELVKRS